MIVYIILKLIWTLIIEITYLISAEYYVTMFSQKRIPSECIWSNPIRFCIFNEYNSSNYRLVKAWYMYRAISPSFRRTIKHSNKQMPQPEALANVSRNNKLLYSLHNGPARRRFTSAWARKVFVFYYGFLNSLINSKFKWFCSKLLYKFKFLPNTYF